jgi:transposase
MKITTVGIDLAKNIFQVHGVDQRGKVVVRKRLRRQQVLTFFAQLPSCLVGMEACGGAHYWARKLQTQGHTVKLMAPQFVKPYVKANKTDAADTEAICEAVTRPNMRFVPIKNADQQAILSLHRARQGFVRARTAQANQIRGLLAEYGITLPQGICHVANRLPEIVEDAENEAATQRGQEPDIYSIASRIAAPNFGGNPLSRSNSSYHSLDPLNPR